MYLIGHYALAIVIEDFKDSTLAVKYHSVILQFTINIKGLLNYFVVKHLHPKLTTTVLVSASFIELDERLSVYQGTKLQRVVSDS